MSHLNKGALEHAERRTLEALADIEKAKTLLMQELRTGEIKRRCNHLGKLVIGHADVSVLAGRNPNFLNGPKHAKTTKVAVELFLDELRDLVEERLQSSHVSKLNVGKTPLTTKMKKVDPAQAELEAKLQATRNELAELRERHERVTSHVHYWANALRAARAEIRLLRTQSRPTIVSIKS